MLSRVFLALLLVACSNEKKEGPPKSTPPTPNALAAMSEDEVVEAALKSMAEIARLAKHHAADCENLAKALAAHAASHKELINAFKKIAADEVKQREIAQKNGGRILAIGQDTVKALEAHCANHEAVKALFQTLNQ